MSELPDFSDLFADIYTQEPNPEVFLSDTQIDFDTLSYNQCNAAPDNLSLCENPSSFFQLLSHLALNSVEVYSRQTIRFRLSFLPHIFRLTQWRTPWVDSTIRLTMVSLSLPLLGLLLRITWLAATEAI
jgi:hypothetical protein